MSECRPRILIITLICAFANLANAGEPSVSDLAGTKTWRRLLHFQGNASKSDIVDPHFFLSSQGANDPSAELQISLEKINSQSLDLSEEERFECRFPARARFIRQNFKVAKSKPCLSYEAWQARAFPDTINFIYASQYVGNPASVFGHSFLRFDRQHHAGLLGFSLTYFAKTDPSEGFATYALKGLFGGYSGVYQFDHYYPKVHGYGSLENRDLWEYELKLTYEERKKIFEHAWELALAGRTPYYFLSRNCTYQLLRLLEVGNDFFDFTSQGNNIYLTPQESVKILNQAGLIMESNYRPSLRQKAQARVESLDWQQKSSLNKVLLGQLAPERVTDPQTSSAIVATLAMNEVTGENSTSAAELRSLFSRAASARAQLPSNTESVMDFKALGAKWNPLNSHPSMQAKLGLISNDERSYLQFGFRPALHALDQLTTGYLPNTQLIFFNAEFRAHDTNQLELYQLDLIDIKSLQSVSMLSHGLSWTAKLALEPVRASACEDCQQIRTAISVGYTKDFLPNWSGYALVGPTIDMLQPWERPEGRLAPSFSVGTINRQLKQLNFHFEERVDHYLTTPFGQETVLTTDMAATLQLSRTSAVTISANQKQNLAQPTQKNSEFGLHYSESF